MNNNSIAEQSEAGGVFCWTATRTLTRITCFCCVAYMRPWGSFSFFPRNLIISSTALSDLKVFVLCLILWLDRNFFCEKQYTDVYLRPMMKICALQNSQMSIDRHHIIFFNGFGVCLKISPAELGKHIPWWDVKRNLDFHKYRREVATMT
jgi:hypothetical protein